MPQAFLILAFLLNLIIFFLSNQMNILAPQYTMFGSQKISPFENCSLNTNKDSRCVASNISTFSNKYIFNIFNLK